MRSTTSTVSSHGRIDDVWSCLLCMHAEEKTNVIYSKANPDIQISTPCRILMVNEEKIVVAMSSESSQFYNHAQS